MLVALGSGVLLLGPVLLVYLLILSRIPPTIFRNVVGKSYYDWAEERIAEARKQRDADYQMALSSYERKLWKHEKGWLMALEKWQRLYYCARCDGVFTEASRFVPVEYMESFLYEW